MTDTGAPGTATRVIDTGTRKGRVLAAALKLAETRDWSSLTLLDIATEANVPLAALREDFSSKSAIVTAFLRAIDDAVLQHTPTASPTAGSEQTNRDRLFDVIMSRFDALQPYKPAVASIAKSGPDLSLLAPYLASQHWMLQAAGIGTDGLGGGLRIAGLGSIYASVFRTWLADDDPGMSRTMAALDQRLRRGEGALKGLETAVDSVTRAADAIPGMLRNVFSARPRRENGPEPGKGPETDAEAQKPADRPATEPPPA
ncbi:MAG: TetR family transcriptional regulator [Hyphomicrobiaceae bacterium]